MNLRYSRRAALQLDAILTYVAAHSPHGAARLLTRIEEVETLLRQFPRSGRETTIPGIRRIAIVPHPYVLDYRNVRRDVIIQRVRHTSRRPTER